MDIFTVPSYRLVTTPTFMLDTSRLCARDMNVRACVIVVSGFPTTRGQLLPRTRSSPFRSLGPLVSATFSKHISTRATPMALRQPFIEKICLTGSTSLFPAAHSGCDRLGDDKGMSWSLAILLLYGEGSDTVISPFRFRSILYQRVTKLKTLSDRRATASNTTRDMSSSDMRGVVVGSALGDVQNRLHHPSSPTTCTVTLRHFPAQIRNDGRCSI